MVSYNLEKVKYSIINQIYDYLSLNDIEKATALLKNITSYYDKDDSLKVMLASLFELNKDYYEALKILKKADIRSFEVFSELTKIYTEIHDYDSLYRLWKLSSDIRFYDITDKESKQKVNNYLRALQIFLYDYDKSITPPLNLSYKEDLYINYNYQKVLKHIKENHLKKQRERWRSVFYKKYNLEKLFLFSSVNLDIEKREFETFSRFTDAYTFAFKSIGTDGFNKNLDYFRVITISNTNKIITMFPLTNPVTSRFCRLPLSQEVCLRNGIYSTEIPKKFEENHSKIKLLH